MIMAWWLWAIMIETIMLVIDFFIVMGFDWREWKGDRRGKR